MPRLKFEKSTYGGMGGNGALGVNRYQPGYPASPALPLKDFVGGAFQVPDKAGGSVVKLDFPVDARFGDGRNHRGAEPLSFRGGNVGAVAFDPTDRELVSAQLPVDIDGPALAGQCTVLTGIGGKLMECHADALCRRGRQPQLRPANRDASADQVGEMRELGADQIVQIDASPVAFDEQVLIGGQGLNAGGEALDE